MADRGSHRCSLNSGSALRPLIKPALSPLASRPSDITPAIRRGCLGEDGLRRSPRAKMLIGLRRLEPSRRYYGSASKALSP